MAVESQVRNIRWSKWFTISQGGTVIGATIGVVGVAAAVLVTGDLENAPAIAWSVMGLYTLWLVERCRQRSIPPGRLASVLARPIVHVTTLAGWTSMQADARARGCPGGHVWIKPSTHLFDRLGLGGRAPGAYAFSGIPSPRMRRRNVGSKANILVKVDPAPLVADLAYRPIDGALFIPGGYLGPAQFETVDGSPLPAVVWLPAPGSFPADRPRAV